MASNYWAKLWIEMLDDPKVARLDDHLWRRWVELILLGKEYNNCGYLPSVADMAWRLRTTDAELYTDLEALAAIGLLSEDSDDVWNVVNFEKRQDAMDNADRQRRHREHKRRDQYYGNETPEPQESNEPVTNRNTDTDTDTEEETDTESAPEPNHNPKGEAEHVFIELFGPFGNDFDRQDILNIETQIGSAAACEVFRWAKRSNIERRNLIQSIVTAAGKWNTGPPSTPATVPKEPIVLDIDLDTQPDWIR